MGHCNIPLFFPSKTKETDEQYFYYPSSLVKQHIINPTNENIKYLKYDMTIEINYGYKTN